MEIFAKEFEKPLNVRGAAVRSLLAGRKTQTRIVINPRLHGKKCPFGKPGYKLWVRERWSMTQPVVNFWAPEPAKFVYAADLHTPRSMEFRNQPWFKWQAAPTLPRYGSRITLEITNVRVERVQDITEADCLAEGILDDGTNDLRGNFEVEWATTNFFKDYKWQENPAVWVIEHRIYEVKASSLLGYEQVTNFIKAS